MVNGADSADSAAFLRAIVDADPDPRCRLAAERTLAVLRLHDSESLPSLTPDDTGTAARVRQAFFVDGEFPADLTALGRLGTGDAEDLLTDLVRRLLSQARGTSSMESLRRGTNRLRLVVQAVTQNGARPVGARLSDPRLASVRPQAREYAARVLSVVRPADILTAARRLVQDSDDPLTALRWLAEAAPQLGSVPEEGTGDALQRLVAAAFPLPRDTRGVRERCVPLPRASSAGTRTAYARMDAPDRVQPGEDFELRVGLAASPNVNVTSPRISVPDTAFTLTVELIAPGFTVLGAGGLRRIIEVSPADPYAYDVVRLRADDHPELAAHRMIMALYRVGERQVGTACIAIGIGAAAAPQPAAPGVDWVLDADSPRPDLEILVTRDNNTSLRRLYWHYRSPHAEIGTSDGVLEVVLDENVAETIRQFYAGIERRDASPDLEFYLNGVAGRLRNAIPAQVWDALEAAAHQVGGPPTVLLATWDARIPWELANVPVPWAEGNSNLGAQAIVGRWPYRTQARSPAPVATLNVKQMAVVSGVYPGNKRLPQAEAECESLRTQYGATTVTPRLQDMLDLLRGAIPADVMHVALHGKFDAGGTQNGILMIDGVSYLDPVSVEGVRHGPVRLAFLNACQVGQSQEVLGDYGGMPSALLSIGAAAVVAPLWKVDDQVAREIAEAFYPAVLNSQSPAEFLRNERANRTTGNTRLAYIYFGHPMLRVFWEGPHA